MNRPRRLVVACVCAGLALRLAFALGYWTGQPLTHDEREYLALARSLARGDGFRYPADEPEPGTAQQFGRAPGYPAFLALLDVTTPVAHVPRRVQVAQSCVGALSVWLIASIARRTGGDRAGVVAAALAASYPPLLFMPAYGLSETVYSALALAAALTLGRAASTHETGAESGLAALGGALTGAASLVRPAMVFFVPFAAAWMLGRRRAAAAVLFVAATAAVVLPWMARNHHAYGRWSVASEGGVTFWTGNHPLARGEGDLAANPQLKAADLQFRTAHPGLTPEALEPLYYRAAFAWIRANPAAWLRLEVRKVFYSVVPLGPSYALHSTRYFAASAVSYLAALIGALVGARRWRALAPPRPAPMALWLLALSTIATGLLFFPQERFRLPVIDPALIVTAALAASVRIDERTDRHSDL